MFVLEFNASTSGIAAVLSVHIEKQCFPVAFFKLFKGAQCSYNVQELEGLAPFGYVRHFAFYLY